MNFVKLINQRKLYGNSKSAKYDFWLADQFTALKKLFLYFPSGALTSAIEIKAVLSVL
jgi:hypothetical protein